MKDVRKICLFSCCFIICLLFTWASFARVMPATKPAPITPKRIEQTGTKFTKPAIEVVSVKDHSYLATKAKLIPENVTIEYNPLNEHSYSWQKKALKWSDDLGEKIWKLKGVDADGFPIGSLEPQGKEGLTVLKALSFFFKFYDKYYGMIEISSTGFVRLGSLGATPSSNKPCGPGKLYDETVPRQNLEGCSTRIFGLHLVQFVVGFEEMYYKSGDGFVQITWIAKSSDTYPFKEMQMQMYLHQSGKIEVSYKKLDEVMAPMHIGLFEGFEMDDELCDFYSDQSGGVIKTTNTNLLYRVDNFGIKPEELVQEIVNRHPNNYYDYVITISDFTISAGVQQNSHMRIMYYDTLGTGLQLTDCKVMDCDLRKHSRALVFLNNIAGRESEANFEENDFYRDLSHEMGHYDLVHHAFGDEGHHWKSSNVPHSAYDSSKKSVMYSTDSYHHGFSWTDLYFMGLASQNEANKDKFLDECFGYMLSDCFGVGGPRVPSYEESSKIFNILIVFLTHKSETEFNNDDEDKAKIEWYQTMMESYIGYWDMITLGRSQLLYDQELPFNSWLIADKDRNLTNIIMALFTDNFSSPYSKEIWEMMKTYKIMKDCGKVFCEPFPEDPLKRAEVIQNMVKNVEGLPGDKKLQFKKELDGLIKGKGNIQKKQNDLIRFNNTQKAGDLGVIY